MTEQVKITTKTKPVDVLHGAALLGDPIRNKGTAFTREERSL